MLVFILKCQMLKVKPTCIPSYGQHGATPLVWKRNLIGFNSWETDPSSDKIYYLIKRFPNEFLVVSITISVFYSIRHDVHFVNYGPFQSKMEDKTGCALTCGNVVIESWRVLRFSVRSCQDILPRPTLLSKYGPSGQQLTASYQTNKHRCKDHTFPWSIHYI